MVASPEGRLIALWQRLGGSAAGRSIFSWMLRYFVPYSGSVHPQLLQFEPGYVRIGMRDRRPLRNHLQSIHAIALANLGELASGLAMLSTLPDGIQAIVTRLEIDYLKKARGPLLAIGRYGPPPAITDTVVQIVQAEISDAAGDVVARLRVHWQLRPKVQKP